MKFVELAFRRETAKPMFAVTFASLASVGLVVARVCWTGHIRYAFLIWNLFLAWLPLVFALFACEKFRNSSRPDYRFFALAGAWLIFFPNAPYIFTDLVHLTTGLYGHFWVDMALILLCALTGLVLGFLSLYLMQSLVTRRFGGVAGWVFIAAVAGLSGFGMYLGRFLRFNSWDVVLQPVKLYHGIGHWVANPHPTSLGFPVLFAAFLFIAYVMLYGLTHLQPAPLVSARERNEILVAT